MVYVDVVVFVVVYVDVVVFGGYVDVVGIVDLCLDSVFVEVFVDCLDYWVHKWIIFRSWGRLSG